MTQIKYWLLAKAPGGLKKTPPALESWPAVTPGRPATVFVLLISERAQGHQGPGRVGFAV